MDTARAEPSDSLHRDGILEAVAFTAERLLLSADWREAADEVLARLGRAAGVSRAYIATNVVWDDGRLASTWLAEWTLPDVVRVMDDPEFRSAPWDEVFGRWSEILARGEVVMGAVASMPEIERPPLLSHGVVSLAKFPVFVDGEWWGAIGFDDCDGVRDWTGDELAALRASATVLGAAVQRQRLNEHALEAETRYREFVEKLPAVTYLDVLDEGVVRVGYISPQVEEVFGYPAERFTSDPNFWLSIVHPDDRARVEETGTVAPTPTARFEQEYRMIAADGHVIWVHDVSTEIVGEASSPRTWQGFLVDVTSRHETEEQLEESEERYRYMIDHSPDAILVHADGRFVFANQEAAELLGAESPGGAGRSADRDDRPSGLPQARRRSRRPPNSSDTSSRSSRRSSSGWTAGRSSSRWRACPCGSRDEPRVR